MQIIYNIKYFVVVIVVKSKFNFINDDYNKRLLNQVSHAFISEGIVVIKITFNTK